VIKFFPDEGYGFLATLDRREIYFHRDSVLHERFDRLAIGTEATFVEEDGTKGLRQAPSSLSAGTTTCNLKETCGAASAT
jgi:cold shock CspA family protein